MYGLRTSDAASQIPGLPNPFLHETHAITMDTAHPAITMTPVTSSMAFMRRASVMIS